MIITNLQVLFSFVTLIISSNIYCNTNSGEQNITTKIKSEYWEIKNQQNYTKDNLYDYINGEADIHFTYNFQKLIVADFALKKTYPDEQHLLKENLCAVTEIYSYSNGYDAYGIYTLLSRDRKKMNEPNILYTFSDRDFIFHKNNYLGVVRTLKKSKKKESKYLVELAYAIAKTIEGEINFPTLIKYMPEKNIDKVNLVYFHDKKILNQFKHFNKNLFVLNEKTNATITRCTFDEKKPSYLLIEYPDNNTCLSAYKILIDKGKNISNNPEIFIQRIEKTYMYISKENKYIIAIIDTHNQKESINLIKLTINTIRKSG